MVLAAERYIFMLENQISSVQDEGELDVDKWIYSMAA